MRKQIITFLFFILWSGVVYASRTYSLHQGNNLNNLSNNSILCMYQDLQGCMWFGTYDGLNKYDGQNVSVFRFELGNKHTLSSNIIHKIIPANRDYLWISTSIGLDLFSLKEQQVSASFKINRDTRLLTSDSLGNTCMLTTQDSLAFYTPSSKKFVSRYVPGINSDNVCALFYNMQGQVSMIMSDGSMKNVTDNSIQNLTFHPQGIKYAFVENQNIYFVDVDGNLFHRNRREDKVTYITNILNLIDNHGIISDITLFHQDVMIAFKSGGLIKLDASKQFHWEAIDLNIGVFCLWKDRKQDLLWMGTDGLGERLYYKDRDVFENILLNNLPITIRKPVRAIYTDELNNLWIGTKGDGLVRINNYGHWSGAKIPANEVSQFTIQEGLANNEVFAFRRSRNNQILWLGTEGPGLSYYSYTEHRIYTLHSPATIPPIRFVHSICEINDSTLWIATAGDGLLEVELAGQKSIKRVTPYIFKKGTNVCNEFHAMEFNGDSSLILGCRGGYGVIRFNIFNKKYTFYNTNNTDNSAIGDVLSIHKSADSTLYFGASSGLTIVKKGLLGKFVIKQFNRKNGIVNDMIHGILEDNLGCIWLSTNKGLANYNPNNDFFYNYYNTDIEVTEFTDDAYWHCPQTNKLFFGGINGLIWIEPREKDLSNYTPPLNISGFKILNRNQNIHHYLDSKTGTLILPASKNSFSLSFVAVDYIYGKNYDYSYKLENLSNNWTRLQKNENINFTNLPSGHYNLKVRYKNDVQGSYEKNYVLPIIVLAHWYLSTIAIGMYVLIFLLICSLIFYFVSREMVRKHHLEKQQLQEEQKEKLYEAKLNFFTNITHELCTPLTLIKGFSEQIEAHYSSPEEVARYIKVLKDNVYNLNDLIHEILDFRKITEQGYNDRNIQQINISELINKQLNSYLDIATHNSINLITSIPSNMQWDTDPTCYKKIVANLLSNAFKYTKPEETIKVELKEMNNQSILSIYNSGKGIAQDQINSIFDLYKVLETLDSNKYTETSSRNGMGLFICQNMVKLLNGTIEVKSVENEFVEFIVSLPPLSLSTMPLIQEQISSASPLQPITDHGSIPLIMVVDDNKDMTWLITDLLAPDYETVSAYSADEALLLLESETPALIITDLMMPGTDGLNFTKQIRSNKFTKHLPLIIVSAKVSEQEQTEGFNAGADAYLTKPFSSAVLKAQVHRLLVNKKNLKEYYYSAESAYEYSEGLLLHQEDKDFMDAVIAIINENIEEEGLKPELIAEKLNLNTRNLYRRFKKISQLSPSDFIKKYRFQYAAKLLLTTNLTVQEIIYKVGFSNKSYFYREFTKKFNKSPKEYRNQSN